MLSDEISPPDALLLLSRSCPYCPAVLKNLSELVKSGDIGRLEVVNVGAHPEIAQKLGVRGVPWLRLGEFELQGQQSMGELRHWISQHNSVAGRSNYLATLLETGLLDQALRYVQESPQALESITELLANKDTELSVRVGIGALFEHLQDQPLLATLITPLKALSEHENIRIRNDAYHFLGLTGDPAAIATLKAGLNDPDAGVREVAEDSLAELQDRLRSQAQH